MHATDLKQSSLSSIDIPDPLAWLTWPTVISSGKFDTSREPCSNGSSQTSTDTSLISSSCVTFKVGTLNSTAGVSVGSDGCASQSCLLGFTESSLHGEWTRVVQISFVAQDLVFKRETDRSEHLLRGSIRYLRRYRREPASSDVLWRRIVAWDQNTWDCWECNSDCERSVWCIVVGVGRRFSTLDSHFCNEKQRFVEELRAYSSTVKSLSDFVLRWI